MYDVRKLSDSALIDLLSTETEKLSALLSDVRYQREYNRSKLFIKALIAEIGERKVLKQQNSRSEPENYFTPD